MCSVRLPLIQKMAVVEAMLLQGSRTSRMPFELIGTKVIKQVGNRKWEKAV